MKYPWVGFIKCSRLSCWLELTGLERSTIILSESLVWKWIFPLFQILLDSLKSRAFMTEPFLEKCLAFDDRRKISLAPCYIGVRSFLCSRHHGTHLGLLLQNTSWQCTSWHCTSQRTQIAGWVRNTTVASCISCIQSATLPAKNHPWSHFVPQIQRAGSFLRYLYEICCSLAQRK